MNFNTNRQTNDSVAPKRTTFLLSAVMSAAPVIEAGPIEPSPIEPSPIEPSPIEAGPIEPWYNRPNYIGTIDQKIWNRCWITIIPFAGWIFGHYQPISEMLMERRAKQDKKKWEEFKAQKLRNVEKSMRKKAYEELRDDAYYEPSDEGMDNNPQSALPIKKLLGINEACTPGDIFQIYNIYTKIYHSDEINDSKAEFNKVKKAFTEFNNDWKAEEDSKKRSGRQLIAKTIAKHRANELELAERRRKKIDDILNPPPPKGPQTLAEAAQAFLNAMNESKIGDENQ